LTTTLISLGEASQVNWEGDEKNEREAGKRVCTRRPIQIEQTMTTQLKMFEKKSEKIPTTVCYINQCVCMWEGILSVSLLKEWPAGYRLAFFSILSYDPFNYGTRKIQYVRWRRRRVPTYHYESVCNSGDPIQYLLPFKSDFWLSLFFFSFIPLFPFSF
jgi:hypothetical protein